MWTLQLLCQMDDCCSWRIFSSLRISYTAKTSSPLNFPPTPWTFCVDLILIDRMDDGRDIDLQAIVGVSVLPSWLHLSFRDGSGMFSSLRKPSDALGPNFKGWCVFSLSVSEDVRRRTLQTHGRRRKTFCCGMMFFRSDHMKFCLCSHHFHALLCFPLHTCHHVENTFLPLYIFCSPDWDKKKILQIDRRNGKWSSSSKKVSLS